VKCPKCGFVSFPGLRQCRKCGSSLESSSDTSSLIPPAWDELEDEDAGSGSQFVSGSVPTSEPPKSEVMPIAEAPSTEDDIPVLATELTAPAEAKQKVNPDSGWANELSERVANFRRRKQSAPNLPDLELSLPFKNEDSVPPERPVVLSPPWRPGLESKKSKSNLDIAVNERGGHHRQSSSSPPLSNSTVSGEEEPELNITPSRETRGRTTHSFDMNFSETLPIPASDFAEVRSGPLGKRLIAGFVDGIVLVASAAVFTIVARLVPTVLGVAAVPIRLGPFNLAMLLCVAAFWIFTYFAAFSTLTGSTPGQAAMGLTVLNFDGTPPTRQECLLRAFGYLVSIASVMLGFIWAAMDSEGLAWHDHISGTYLGERDSSTS
jgi:uncharacterized RDD family membrane protein YckC